MHHAIRPRITPGVTGAVARIRLGLFGDSTPQNLPVITYGSGFDGMYSYHQGDLFTPGAQNFVWESNFELPLNTVWGRGYLSPANNFNPRQPPPLQAVPRVVLNGLGGLEAGQIAYAPLIEGPADIGG